MVVQLVEDTRIQQDSMWYIMRHKVYMQPPIHIPPGRWSLLVVYTLVVAVEALCEH